MANFRISSECSGPAARHIGKHGVEFSFKIQMRCIGKPALYAIAQYAEPLPQFTQPLVTAIACDDLCVRIPFSDDQRLAAWGRAAVQNSSAPRQKLRDQLRPLILNPRTAIKESCGFRDVS